MENVKNTPKIDIHAHAVVFREYYPPHFPGQYESAFVSAEQLINMYDEINVEKGILLPISSPEGQVSPLPSEGCKYLVDKYPNRFDWFCNVDPRAFPNTKDGDLVSLIKHYKSLGAKGVGEITAHIAVDDPKVDNLFSACEECDMPVIIHISPTYESGYGIYDEKGLPRLEKMIKKHPNLKFLGHSQAFWTEITSDLTEEDRMDNPPGKIKEGGRVIELLRKYPNLYCDHSANSGSNALMRDPDFAAKFIEEFSDRIMYGCDICRPTNTHHLDFNNFLNDMLDNGKISAENYKKLVRENAIRILKLED